MTESDGTLHRSVTRSSWQSVSRSFLSLSHRIAPDWFFCLFVVFSRVLTSFIGILRPYFLLIRETSSRSATSSFRTANR